MIFYIFFINSRWVPSSVWPVVGILLAAGLLLAITTLYFQKGLTILGTAISGGAIMSATLDYFIEKVRGPDEEKQ